MEWRVLVGERFSNRKTAVIQICDLQTILIIQLSAMKGSYQNLQVNVTYSRISTNCRSFSGKGQGNDLECMLSFHAENVDRPW